MCRGQRTPPTLWRRHGRQAPPPGRQQAAWRQSWPLSGSLRAFQTPGCTPGYRRKSEKCPSTPFSQRAGRARSATPASAWNRNRRRPRAVVGLLFRADYRCLPPGNRSRLRQQRQHEHRRARDLGTRTPLTAVRHRTRTSNNNSTPALRPRRGPLQLITASLTQIREPSMQFPPPGWSTRHRIQATQGDGRYQLRPPFELTVRLIQKSHPAILAVTGSDHSPGGFLFPERVAFFTGIRDFSKSAVIVPKVRTSSRSAAPSTPALTKFATTVFLWTSNPQLQLFTIRIASPPQGCESAAIDVGQPRI